MATTSDAADAAAAPTAGSVDALPSAVLSVFGQGGLYAAPGSVPAGPSTGDAVPVAGTEGVVRLCAPHDVQRASEDIGFLAEIDAVRAAISSGVHPQMIAQGSSGSYFARIRVPVPPDDDELLEQDVCWTALTVGVFKPKDEEPYGELNPKRQVLSKYLWWAMGRACLIDNFSYLSEVGASLLDDHLGLGIVPPTRLAAFSSPSFFYSWEDRAAADRGTPLPDKLGSYQRFLHGYRTLSDFLRDHPWPGKAQELARDLEREQKAHDQARRDSRQCGPDFLLQCGGSRGTAEHPPADKDNEEERAPPPAPATVPTSDTFQWTPALMGSFRLQMERLAVLDYLMRNTDRGLDNVMVRCVPREGKGGWEMRIGAIDSSLSFPHSHPKGRREYPFGWLWLPHDMVGHPFSRGLRESLLPRLLDPLWWHELIQSLRTLFASDPAFDEQIFQNQMSVMKGQACNVVESLRSPTDGPFELCARPKKVVVTDTAEMTANELWRWCAGRVEQQLWDEQDMQDKQDIQNKQDTQDKPDEQDQQDKDKNQQDKDKNQQDKDKHVYEESEPDPTPEEPKPPTPFRWQASTALVFHPNFASEVIQHAQYCLAQVEERAASGVPMPQKDAKVKNSIETPADDARTDATKADDATLHEAGREDREATGTAEDDPKPAETAADDTTADEVAADDTTADEVAADDTTADEVAADDTTADEVAADGTIADETTVGETSVDETMVDRLAAALSMGLWPGADEGKVQTVALVERERVVEDGSRGLIWWY